MSWKEIGTTPRGRKILQKDDQYRIQSGRHYRDYSANQLKRIYEVLNRSDRNLSTYDITLATDLTYGDVQERLYILMVKGEIKRKWSETKRPGGREYVYYIPKVKLVRKLKRWMLKATRKASKETIKTNHRLRELKKRPRITSIEKSEERFWIFQANPKRFKILDWWDDMKRRDQWRINKRHRDKIRKMGIDAIWVAMVGEDDMWSIKMQYHEKIANAGLEATFLSEKYDTWSIFQHKNEIHKGDVAAIWLAGTDDIAGIYGIAEIVTDPYEAPLPREGNIMYWVEEKDKEQLPKAPWLRVSIRYLKLSDRGGDPLLSRVSARNDPELQDLIILRFAQATNLGPIPQRQWQRIMELTSLAF